MNDVLNGFASLGTLQDDVDIKELQNRNSNEVTMGTGAPDQAQGKVGDITVREIPGIGIRAYIKTSFAGWYDISAMRATPRLEWRDMILTGGWEAYATNGDTAPQYAKDSNGFVHFRGAISEGSHNGSFTTLPEGFRPYRGIYTSGGVELQSKAPLSLLIGTGGTCSFNQWIIGSGTITTNTARDTYGRYIDGISFYTHKQPESVQAGSIGYQSDGMADISEGLVA